MTINIVTIHHEGAGEPSDTTQPEYTYWIGKTGWKRIQAASTSYATFGYNHVSTDICLSGNRMLFQVTNQDIQWIREACQDSRIKDRLVSNPKVQAHRWTYPTLCPGNNTMARWVPIRAACNAGLSTTYPYLKGNLLTTVAYKTGTGTCRPIPELGCILNENGARLKGDTPSGNNFVWKSTDPLIVSTGHQLVDIAATTDNTGVIALFTVAPNDVRPYFVPFG
jgi:hypothetical protein